MKFVVCGRFQAEALDLREPHAVISIREPGSIIPAIPENEFCRGILRLEFEDVVRALDPETRLFTPALAREILEFVAGVREGITTLVVHCEAGISRSAGVAAALSKTYLGVDQPFFERYIPNSLVYATLLEVWRELEEGACQPRR